MLENKTISKRLEVIKQKCNADFNVSIVTDAIETVFSKDVTNANEFLSASMNATEENYPVLKSQYVVKKKREFSQEVQDKRFNKAYEKLLKKYGKEVK